MSKEEITYQTLSFESEGLYKEKGSKFIAYACSVKSEEEVKEKLESWRKQHHQARHLCYAYRIGIEENRYRTNDDGEPNNSAGIPIYGQIQSYELNQVLIGVIRYFGGTKLGVGGLIQAYKTAAKLAIEENEICTKTIYLLAELHFTYAEMPEVMTFCKQQNLAILAQDFQLDCKLKLEIPRNQIQTVDEFIADKDIKINKIGIF